MTDEEENPGMDVAVGAVGSGGERRSSTLSTAQDDGAVAALAAGQRWSLSRRRDVVLRLMQGEPVEDLSRRLAVPVWKLEEWRQRELAGIDAGLRERDDDPKERELAEAHRRIGGTFGGLAAETPSFVVLQPATASSKAPNPKILRRSPPLWTFPRLDGSAVPMSHLTPMVGSTVWPGGHARGNKSRQEFTPNVAKVSGRLAATSDFIPIGLATFSGTKLGDRP